MKIIAGTRGGRSLQQPATRSVRPLSEKVRAALFDVVGDPVNLAVLDAYAGSGAAGFEALSRGALMVDAIEVNPRVARVIQANMAALELGITYILHQLSVETWLAAPAQQPAGPRYGLIIADPPYALLDADVINRLTAYLVTSGILALSHGTKNSAPGLPNAERIKTKTYGDTSLSFYRSR